MYQEPEMEVVSFESKDILTQSHILPEDDE